MLSEEMMYYINMAVGDGKLESKELEFLKQKAAELGANPIEVEMTATTHATQAKKTSNDGKHSLPKLRSTVESNDRRM